jgi:hypothetical protein
LLFYPLFYCHELTQCRLVALCSYPAITYTSNAQCMASASTFCRDQGLGKCCACSATAFGVAGSTSTTTSTDTGLYEPPPPADAPPPL